MNFGKCHQYLDPKNSTSGLQCKCFMFRATENGKYLCACCGHDRNYHEPPSQHFDSTNRTSIPTSIQSSTAAQEPDEFNVENFEINVELNTRVRVDRKNVFKVINLFNVGPKPKIPRGIKKFKKRGIMNSIQFSEDSSNGIKKVIEAAFTWLENRNWVFFRCDSTSALRVADIPAKGWNIKALTKISGCRKKLYIGVVSSSSVELVNESNMMTNDVIDQGSSTSASTSSSSQPVPMNTTDCGAFTMPYTGINAPTNFIDQSSSTSASTSSLSQPVPMNTTDRGAFTIMPYTGINAPQIQSHPTENFQSITNYQQTEIFQANYQSATNLEPNLFDAYRIMNLNHHRA